jgi:CBS domain containing-hemolysin-like protein
VEQSTEFDEILEKFIAEGYSRMPVYSGSIDNIIGEIYAKDVIKIFTSEGFKRLSDFIRKPYFVHEDDKINLILRKMQVNKVHLAIVQDEFGGTAGIISLEDILEELVGEIQDEYDEETPQMKQLDKQSFELQTKLPIDDVNDSMPEPFPESDDYETIGGYILFELGRIPDLGEKFTLGNYEFEILERTQLGLERVKLTFLGKDEEGE